MTFPSAFFSFHAPTKASTKELELEFGPFGDTLITSNVFDIVIDMCDVVTCDSLSALSRYTSLGSIQFFA